MSDFTISIFSNKIFFEILKEMKLFSKFKIMHHDDLNLCIKAAEKENQIVVFFNTSLNKIKLNNSTLILISKSIKVKNKIPSAMVEKLQMPFSILEFEKKIVSLIAKNQFKKNSLINLRGYVIDKNERKIKKNNLELQLSEKEVNFLILFSENKKPINKNLVLKNVWHYSEETETHTVETHIHRLRKKILEKFGDENFIKNNNEGYYI